MVAETQTIKHTQFNSTKIKKKEKGYTRSRAKALIPLDMDPLV